MYLIIDGDVKINLEIVYAKYICILLHVYRLKIFIVLIFVYILIQFSNVWQVI